VEDLPPRERHGVQLRASAGELALTNGDTDQFTFDPAPDTSDLTAEGSREILLRFQPSGVGVKSATITIVSNDPDEAARTLLLTGRGVNPFAVSNVLLY
jgi:hypothetical protein